MDQRITPLSTQDDEIAREKGRLLACQAIAHNPDAMKRVVDTFGIEYVKRRYPEAFAKPSVFGRILDRIKFVGHQ